MKTNTRSSCMWTVPCPPTRKSSWPRTPACPWVPCRIRWTFPEQLEKGCCRRTWGTNFMLWEEVFEKKNFQDYSLLITLLDNSSRRQAKGWRSGSRRSGRRRSGLPAHLTTAFWTFLCGASLTYWSMQSFTKESRTWTRRWRWGWGPYKQGHRGEGLLVVQLQDQGCRRRWQPFHWMTWFLICSSANFICRMIFSCDVWACKTGFKIPYLLLPPCIFGYFSENLGLFRFVSKQFCLFRLFRYRLETPKQTEICCFWFHETNRNKRETDFVSVCFGSNRNLFLFVSRTPYSQLGIEAVVLTSPR